MHMSVALALAELEFETCGSGRRSGSLPVLLAGYFPGLGYPLKDPGEAFCDVLGVVLHLIGAVGGHLALPCAAWPPSASGGIVSVHNSSPGDSILSEWGLLLLQIQVLHLVNRASIPSTSWWDHPLLQCCSLYQANASVWESGVISPAGGSPYCSRTRFSWSLMMALVNRLALTGLRVSWLCRIILMQNLGGQLH